MKETLAATPKEIATRIASEQALEAITAAVPEMIGGSADLTGSNNTRTKAMKALSASDYAGRFIHYGVREHGMAAAMNGMALHGGIIPYSGTFLVFSDYCRPAIRLAALMGERVIHVMTHDSIGLGEDGPTHQPVEHLAALRAIPNLLVFRPCDTVETLECWQLALEGARPPERAGADAAEPAAASPRHRSTPTAARPAPTRSCRPTARRRCRCSPPVPRSRSRSRRRKLLSEQGVPARVVSVPCFELLLEAPDAVRRAVIGDAPVKVAVEAGVRQGWDAIIGADGGFVGHGRLRRQRALQGPLQALRHHAAGGRGGGIEQALKSVITTAGHLHLSWPGFVPAIHVLSAGEQRDVDARDKRGHDDRLGA